MDCLKQFLDYSFTLFHWPILYFNSRRKYTLSEVVTILYGLCSGF